MLNFEPKRNFVKSNLIKLFDILILPNISITPEDQEEYEDDPDAYVRNDLEEQDSETRRRICMKFVNQLSNRFPAEVNGLIESYMNTYLGDYQANRESQWAKKTSLINLLITASINNYTYRAGASEIKIP